LIEEFDPLNIARHEAEGIPDVMVLASDYDKLLELWRNQKEEILECYAELGI
jgi:ABC-type phosphate/phosphonate transport system substrate-binding protein